MKTIGIITLYHGSDNFGTLLQGFALQKKLQELGYTSEIIDIKRKGQRADYSRSRFRLYGFGKSVEIIKAKVLSKLFRLPQQAQKGFMARKKKCEQFAACIAHSRPYREEELYENPPEYDYFIVGSDQVWNPAWRQGCFMLDFVPPAKRKIAYAPSMGVCDITEEERASYANSLKDFYAVSVREMGAQMLLKNSYQSEIYTVLDPTMLYEDSFWDSIAVAPQIQKPYVFVYILHWNESKKKEIFWFCRRNKLRMVSVPQKKREDFKYSDIPLYDAGPCEWIGYIRHADYVFVDSFHGTVFSAIFHKNFWSFEETPKIDAPKGSLRIESLLLQLGLENRMLIKGQFPADEEVAKHIDYTACDENLAGMRLQSEMFLRSALL